MSKPKICLVMIVKNEERVINRCLNALKPYVDHWVIVDTGSTDATPAIIAETMKGVSGEIYYREFQSFQHNRTEVMALARKDFPDSDYLLMIDADDTWEVPNGWQWPELTHGAYNVKHSMGGESWQRPALTKASLPWEYRAAAHEYMVCEVPHTLGKLKGPRIRCGNDGARRQTEGTAKYKRIAGILERERAKDPTNRRTIYYLAQSYRDGGEFEKALQFYQERAAMGGFQEEVWSALYQAAILKEKLGHPWQECQEAYLRAYDYRPTRAESLWALAALCRINKQLSLAKIYASAAVMTKMPDDNLFINEAVYSWRALDEYCIACNKLDMMNEAKWAALRLLINPDVDGLHRLRIEENLTFSCYPITHRRVSPYEKIVVVLATYEPEPEALRAAVESIINQSHQEWELIIVSDGNKIPPWNILKDIQDERISMYHLPKNIGQFAIYDAILHQTDARLFAIQDDDDISKPDRLQKLLKNMLRTNADVVFSDIEIERQDGKVIYWPAHPEWLGKQPNQIVHAGSHVGLWKTESLRAIGGYFGGFRIAADTAVVGLMSRLGRPAFVREGLYRAKRTPKSMMTDDSTGMGSANREKEWSSIQKLWFQVQSSENPLQKAHELMRAGCSEVDFEFIKNIFSKG